MSKEEITATFITERHRFPNDDCDVIIGEARLSPSRESESNQLDLDDIDDSPFITIKGPSLDGELRTNQEYVFFGRWTSYTNKRTGKTEKQFAFNSFVKTAPVSREAVISYLKQHGEQCGVGNARAVKLWEAFGQDAVEISRTSPERVIEALASAKLKLTSEQAKEFSAKLKADQATEKAKIALSSLLEGRGFPKNIATICIQEWGNKAAQIISRDPYRLMKFKHCGFKRCDAMWMDLKLPPDRLKRQAYCVWYSLTRANDGSTWFPWSYPDAYLKATISGAKLDLEAAITLAKRGKIISELKTNSLGVIDSQDGTKRWFAEHKNAHHENQIAQSIVYARGEKNLWPDVSQLTDLSDHQRAELRNALQDLICILGGSPGTGKTYCVASLVELIGKVFGYQHVIIGTPTGKAAVRVTENLSLRGIPVRARTWHSLLNSLDSEGLQHFPVKFIIGDETSMNDTDLMARILRARSVGSHVLFVGDINQLPPVGHGAPLRDMIAAGVAYGELREIKRNSGGIVEACAAIRDNVQWTPGDNLILDHQNKAENQIASLLRWLDEAKKQGIDPVWECQPVVAVNEKSPLARKELNKLLQQKLNLKAGIEGCPFRMFDKLVNTENGFFTLVESNEMDQIVTNDKGDVYVANGELAKVVDIKAKTVLVELQSPHRIVQFHLGKPEKVEKEDDKGTGCTFDLGYALSVHKCVHPDTIVESDQGLLPIRLIAGEGKIGTPSGSNPYCNLVYFDERECVNIKTHHGHEIIVTMDHKCEAWNGSSFELEEAGNLNVGQWVRQKLGVSIEPSSVPFLPGGACKTPHKVTEDFAEFCGLMVADGTVFARGFRFGKGNEEVVLRFSALCKKLFGCETVLWHVPGKVTGIYFCEVRSSAIAKWLLRIGGMSPNSKATPECILRSPSTIQSAFLRGLFEDGSVHVKNGKLDHINWTTVYPELRKEAQVMLLRLGIVSSVNSQRKSQGSIYIYSTFAKLFQDKIGLISHHKKERLCFPVGSENGESQRFQIPVNLEFCEKHRDSIVKATSRAIYENLRARKVISRSMAKRIAELVPEFGEMLNWHYSKIQSIEQTTGPAMCVEVPGEHRFLQNGFPWGNSQGSDWPWVIPLLDDYGGAVRVCDRSWLYTAISRAKSKCILIGTKNRADSMCRVSSITKRKTFLREQILMMQSTELLAGV